MALDKHEGHVLNEAKLLILYILIWSLFTFLTLLLSYIISSREYRVGELELRGTRFAVIRCFSKKLQAHLFTVLENIYFVQKNSVLTSFAGNLINTGNSRTNIGTSALKVI